MKTIILILSLSLCLLVNGQKWTYSSGNDVFDGVYRTSSVKGTGGSFPYTSPSLVINFYEKDNEPNIYFVNAGYAGCDSKKIYLKFDRDDKIYIFWSTTNSNKDTWFISDDIDNSITIIELFDKFMSHSFIDARLSSDCGETNYKFTLSGSTSAINFVVKNWLNDARSAFKQQQVIKQEELRKAEREKFVNDSIRKDKELRLKLKEALINEKKDSIVLSLKTLYPDEKFKVVVNKYAIKLYQNNSGNQSYETLPINTVMVIDEILSEKDVFNVIVFIDDGRKGTFYSNKYGVVEL